MKVIQILGHYYPVIGGKEKAVLNYSKELRNYGYDVEILASNFDRRGRKTTAKKEGVYENIKYRLFDGLFMLGPTAVFFPGIIGYLMKADYDVIITNTYRQPQTDIALICAKIRGKKCFLMTHNSMVHKRKGFNKLFVKFYDFIIAPITLRFYDKIICLSKESFPFFKKFGIKNKKLKEIPLGVEDFYFKKLLPNDNPYKKTNDIEKVILNVGTFGRVKGQDLLIEAIPLIKNKVQVYFIGSDDGYRSELEGIIMRKGLSNVKFLDSKKPEELMKFYQFADLFVLPSRSEGFGIVVLEALASGLPVLGTKHGLIKTIINEKVGLVVDPYNISELAKSIDRILDKMYSSQDSIQLANDYRWNKAGEKLHELLILD